MQITLDLSELKDLESRLSTLEEFKAPLLRELGNYLYNTAKDSFDNERDYNGTPWSPLSSTTYLLKQKKGKPDKKLLYDGDLRSRFTTTYEASSVSVGTNAKSSDGFLYPSVHQFGTKRAGRNNKVTIKARPFLPFHRNGTLYDGVKDDIRKITVEFIDSVVKV